MTVPELEWFSAGLHSLPTGPQWMDPALSKRLETMRYTKRYSEARLARWAAKTAIARSLGLSTADETLAQVVVSNAPDGAPEAHIAGRQIEAVIAMTDRADWAVCAILRHGGRVGCDLELVEPRSPSFLADYLTPVERDAVAANSEPDLIANAIWSAKESALKVLRTGLRRDTRSVEVTLRADDNAGWHRLEVRADEGRTFPGWWIRYNKFLLTFATEEPTPPPSSLDSPPALASATPTHSWMDDLLR